MTAVLGRGLTKAFGASTVVKDVDLTIAAGTVHSLVGANGAGKSTLLGMLSGRLRPSSGEVEVFGRSLSGGHPREAIRAGLTAVHQELTVMPALTACANVFLGQELSRGPLLRSGAMVARYQELAGSLDVDVPADRRAGELKVAAQQMLEIMRAVQADARVILFDEPTAALSERERRNFLRLVERLRSQGRTVVLVTHNLAEVLAVSDVVTVMRSGAKVAEAPVRDWDKGRLVRAMTGSQVPSGGLHRAGPLGERVLSVQRLNVPGVLSGVDLSVRAGEVVGLAGLVGSGRSTLLRSLAGAETRATGSITVGDAPPTPLPRSVRDAVRRGIALLPEERKTEGLVLGMSAPDNVTLTDLSKVSAWGLVHRHRQVHETSGLLSRLALTREVGHYPVGHLSGGNQQKVALAKWLFRRPRVLLVDEPTRGIDVAAKVEVLAAVRDLAEAGTAVILTSAEIEEVLEVSDRVLVLTGGRIRAEYQDPNEFPSVNRIHDITFGVDHVN